MAQHDYVIANDTAANVRSDLNDALSAIVSQNSGATAPSTTYANMLWYDTANNIIKMRSEADDAWINVGYLDQLSNAFHILDDTQVVNTSGTQTGLLGDQSEATWETGTSTTESLVSPAKVKAAVEALASGGGVGVDQTWQDVSGSRSPGTTYQNTTGKPIMVAVSAFGSSDRLNVSSDNITFIEVGEVPSDRIGQAVAIVPDQHYYFFEPPTGINLWAELR